MEHHKLVKIFFLTGTKTSGTLKIYQMNSIKVQLVKGYIKRNLWALPEEFQIHLNITFHTCMFPLAASKLHWGKMKPWDICGTEPYHLHKKQHEDPFVQHELEFDCNNASNKLGVEIWWKINASTIYNLLWKTKPKRYTDKNPRRMIDSQPVNVTSMSQGTTIDKIFLAPLAQNFIFFLFAEPRHSLLQELIRRMVHVNQSEVVSLWTRKASHCSSCLATWR